MGSILEQDDALGRSHPVAFYSKSLQPVECNYEIHNKELLAIIHALKHFHHYLQGSAHQTKIFSNHANLKYFTTKQMLTRRQAQWSLFLSTFDYIIIPKPGKINKADALSRCPDYKEGIASENAETILLTPEKFLLKPEQFHIRALHNMAIPTGINKELKEAIQEAIKTDTLTGQKLKDILTVTILGPYPNFPPFYFALSVTRPLLIPSRAARTVTKSPDKSPDRPHD